MKISRTDDGKTIIMLDTWDEIGIRIVLPHPKAHVVPDDINLQKIPLEVSVSASSATDAEIYPIFSATVEPLYCPHGTLDSVNVTITNNEKPFEFLFPIFPFDAEGETQCQEEGGSDDES